MAGRLRTRVKVKLDLTPLRALRANYEAVLRELDLPLRDAARQTLDTSAFLVPRGGAPDDPLNLSDTGFLDGPHLNRERKSTTWTCGYSHPAAGAIHQGFHWGAKTRVPPDFLRRATRGVAAKLRKGMGPVLMRAIAKFTSK